VNYGSCGHPSAYVYNPFKGEFKSELELTSLVIIAN